MKKYVLAAGALTGILALASCSQVASNAPVNNAGSGDKEVLYSGVMPAADADGTVYALKMEYDDETNYMDGDYSMTETTITTDSIGAFKVVATTYTSGDFRVESKSVDGKEVKYVKLLPDAKDALGISSSASGYFVVNADESLTMVNADLTLPEKTEFYTLTPVK